MGKRQIGHHIHKAKLQKQLRSAIITISVLVHKNEIDAKEAESRIKYNSRLFIAKYGISMFLEIAKDFCTFAAIRKTIQVENTKIVLPLIFEPLQKHIDLLSA
jgi:hypothetical protein